MARYCHDRRPPCLPERLSDKLIGQLTYIRFEAATAMQQRQQGNDSKNDAHETQMMPDLFLPSTGTRARAHHIDFCHSFGSGPTEYYYWGGAAVSYSGLITTLVSYVPAF